MALALNNLQRVDMHLNKETKPKQTNQNKRACPRGVMVKVMDCGIIISKFILQLRYYIHFRANTLGKGMNPLILQAMG